MRITMDDQQFMKEMNNIMNYSIGFLEGVQAGKTKFLQTFAVSIIEILKEYIDSNARIDPQLLHHVYEWNQIGESRGRLFDIEYVVNGFGLSINSTFRQSSSVKEGSYEPFYDKAQIMESGIPVIIRPKKSNVLRFDVNGEEVFTQKPVKVGNPGGDAVAGSYEKVFESFFNQYLTQSFLQASGILGYLQNAKSYKNNLYVGMRQGKSHGKKVGYQWIVGAGVLND